MIVIGCQEVSRNLKTARIAELETYLNKQGFVNIEVSFNNMWEIFMIIFVKERLATEVQSLKKTQIAKGKFGYVGNKGAVAYSFVFRNKIFNFIACHLQHGQFKAIARHTMMSELVREIKLQNAQTKLFKGLESDTYADYSFIFGDLNYRINSTYMYLSRHMEECKDMNTEQLSIAMHNGYYPGYKEPPMDWMPTYKCSFTDHGYADKKD
jgi:hypothetical protein